MNLDKLRINCTNIPLIMAGAKEPITDKQNKELEKLLQKEKLTDRQKSRIKILQDKRDAKQVETIGGSAKKMLISMYCKHKCGKRMEILNEQICNNVASVKGVVTESNSVEMLSKFDNKQYYRYKKYIKNDYLIGVLDAIDAECLENATKIIEIKTPLQMTTFLDYLTRPISNSTYLQLQGYMAITGLKEAELAYCLADLPDELILKQKSLYRSKFMGVYSEERFEEIWNKVADNFRYDNIPISERIIKKKVLRDDAIIDKIYQRVEFCRAWVVNFSNNHLEMVKSGIFDT